MFEALYDLFRAHKIYFRTPVLFSSVLPSSAGLAITNLHKGLQISCNNQFAEIGKSKNVNLDFLFRIIFYVNTYNWRYLEIFLIIT